MKPGYPDDSDFPMRVVCYQCDWSVRIDGEEAYEEIIFEGCDTPDCAGTLGTEPLE